MKKFVLIIGSNSFSGSNFIDFLLDKNFKVYGISRSSENKKIFLKYKSNKNLKNFKFFKMDLNKDIKKIINLIKLKKPQYIINFAAQGMVAESWYNPIDWYNTNLSSQVKLMENIKKFRFIKKFIQFSTPEVYGNFDNFLKENFNFNPTTPYANSRASIDLHLRNLFNTYKFPIIITRTANVYGPTQQIYRIIPKTILSVILKKKLSLHGGGNSRRSFIHIDDVSRALLKILINGKIGDTYHISTNNFISIKNLVLKIFKTMKGNRKLIKNTSDRPGKDANYKLSSLKLRKKLDWKPEINLATGLKETIEWTYKNIVYLNKANKEYKHKK